jgi:hypothetical protein
VNNFIQIMALSEDDMHRTTFVSDQKEAGIGLSFDPSQGTFAYNVFVHKRLPLCTQSEWVFENFNEARRFAAQEFGQGWRMLMWDQTVRRPCETGEHECGSGSCESCQSSGGGCTSCGALE